MKTLLLLISYLCIAHFQLTAQYSISDSLKIDSMRRVLPGLKEDTGKVNMLNKISIGLPHDRDEAKRYANTALLLAQKLHFKNGEGMAYYALAKAERGLNYYGKEGDINIVKKYVDKALEKFKETKNDLAIADCYYDLGYAYSEIGQNYTDGLQYTLKALAMYEKLNEKFSMARCYKDLGSQYSDNRQESSKMFEKAINIYTEINDSVQMAYCYNLIGTNYRYDRQPEKALENLNKALSLYQRLGSRAPDYGISWTKGNIGEIYYDQGANALQEGKTSEAREKLLTALKIFEERLIGEEKRKSSHRVTYIELGDCNLALAYTTEGSEHSKRIKESRKYYLLSLDLAKQTNDKFFLMSTYYKLMYLDAAAENYKGAYENLQLATI